jgi:membrane carboxypeptidase/penicillin-binding protein
MKLLVTIVFAGLVLVVLVTAVMLGWFYFYTRDLPDVAHLAQFAPSAPAALTDTCLTGSVTVLPAAQTGKTLRNAIDVAEPRRAQSLIVARSLLCGPRILRALSYGLDQLRVDHQIRARFSWDQILTIYMNRVYVSDGKFGVEDASHHFFGKDPVNLSVAEAALLAGIIRVGDGLSPLEQPDRALHRRTQVIEAMRAKGLLTAAEAAKAQAEPLGVLPAPNK